MLQTQIEGLVGQREEQNRKIKALKEQNAQLEAQLNKLTKGSFI